jgi:hypothetical protein
MPEIMTKRNIGTQKKKRRGRPPKPGGRDPSVSARLPRQLIAGIEAWAKANGVVRQEAIRRLIEQALANGQSRKTSKKAAAKAREMADQEIERIGDESIPSEERERRKGRLTKGPREFREMRRDLPKE